ncbi:MAG: hypothetical protein Q7T18_01910, partial [Sedimentisphaerales bacterium]|nr:hypothetical protein [Sedimentisphaerales bacterium]
GQGGKGVFVSEYGVASAVNLERTVRHYEQRGKGSCGEAKFYRQALDQFYADWERWNMAQCFGRPQEYFEQCIAQMAEQRLLGINALRGNPSCIGYSLTGTVDQGYSGEGLTTAFRELKPGTVDAIFEGFAPLRWCLFVEPVNVYRGTKVKLEAVLANEDVLRPGEYPVRLEVFSSGMQKVFSRTVTVKIADRGGKSEPAFALPVFAEEITTDWPSDSYRFTATFERDGAPAGGTTEFYVTDAAAMPAVETEVVLWGEDAELAGWLGTHGIKVKPFADSPQKAGEVILVSRNAAGPDKAGALRELTDRINQGAHAIFLCPQVFDQNGVPVTMLQPSGKLSLVSMWSTVYHKDEWAKRHPIFDGLPAGGILNTAYYREMLSPLAWVGQSTPAEAVAGAIHAQPSYSSGLQVAVYKLGQGNFILNTLQIRENLGKHPAAERLLRNMVRYAAQNVDKP